MCQQHWDRLREKVDERGLLHLVAPDGQTAAAQVADQFEKAAEGRDETTPANFDPLMGCFWAIGSNVMGSLGRSALYLLSGPDAPEDPIDFAQFGNGPAVRSRLALLGHQLTWPRNCGLCYLNLAHELTCTEASCTLPKVDGYDYWLDRAADDAKAKAIELGLVKA